MGASVSSLSDYYGIGTRSDKIVIVTAEMAARPLEPHRYLFYRKQIDMAPSGIMVWHGFC